jgi:hypothetical protein
MAFYSPASVTLKWRILYGTLSESGGQPKWRDRAFEHPIRTSSIGTSREVEAAWQARDLIARRSSKNQPMQSCGWQWCCASLE